LVDRAASSEGPVPELTLLPNPPVTVARGVTLLDASEALGVPLESDCGGVAACNACRVRVLSGAEHLSPRGPEEEPFLDGPDQRLGCQARVLGDVVVRPDPGL
jgi:ferredoxin, 2Fe-2S